MSGRSVKHTETQFWNFSKGVYFAYKGQKSTSEFLMASRQMTLFPTTMSLSCRLVSSTTILC